MSHKNQQQLNHFGNKTPGLPRVHLTPHTYSCQRQSVQGGFLLHKHFTILKLCLTLYLFIMFIGKYTVGQNWGVGYSTWAAVIAGWESTKTYFQYGITDDPTYFANYTQVHINLRTGPVFSYRLRYIVGFGLVEMAISTNPKPTIYRNLYENTGHLQS